MNKVRIIGDVHGNWIEYCKIIDELPKDTISIVVGDMGIGFGPEVTHYDPIKNEPLFPNNFFIRGNHDNPGVCRKHPRYIPDGTYFRNKIFCVGGAISIDQAWRTEGVSWWRDEELSYSELQDMIDKYIELKPDYVITHDGPESIIQRMFSFYIPGVYPSRTRVAFDTMLREHKPKWWVFGHWHKTRKIEVDGTNFICLGINDFVDMEIDND